MSRNRNRFVTWAAVAGLVAFAGDFLVTFILGFFYPNYHHLRMVMSDLGTTESPVALLVGWWWIFGGLLLLVFAVGVRMAFAARRPGAAWVMVLVALFSLGSWVCSGLFPLDPGGVETTLSGKLHGILGGIGYVALSFVPLVSLALFPRRQMPAMAGFSVAAFVLGLALLVTFIGSEDAVSQDGLWSLAGLWQRLFLLVHYGYLGVVAGRMIGAARRPAGEVSGDA